jgi:23S rRNA pseudouridine1911/1915/1917 synthase
MNEAPEQAERRVVRHTVESEDAGERADVVLGRRIPALSRRQARALARVGKLRIDGRRQPPAARVATGQTLELELELESERSNIPELGELEILAQTERFIYVHKPAGVHTVALTPAQPGVLATAVAQRWPECASASEDPREGGAVHRLDQPTSGVVAFARSPEVWARARAGFTEERVAKHYLAVCEHSPTGWSWPPALPESGLRGWIEPASEFDDADADELSELRERLGPLIGEGLEPPWSSAVRIRAAIGREGGQQRSAVRLDGRRASTVVRPLAAADNRWLVRLLLETGRRHQARVHLTWVGLPILGDPVYGRAAPDDTRAPTMHLHAFAIDLSTVFAAEHPVYATPPPGFWPPARPCEAQEW